MNVEAMKQVLDALEIGYKHNNCLGCVKSTGQGYWNKIRLDFPERFWMMAGMSRALGVRMVESDGKRIFLDELQPGRGRYQDEPEIQCGIFCEMANNEIKISHGIARGEK